MKFSVDKKVFKKQVKPIIKKRLPPKESLALSLIKMIYDRVTLLYPDIAIGIHDISVEHPEDELHGDYSTNIAMKLFKNFQFSISNFQSISNDKISKQEIKTPLELAAFIAKSIPKNGLIEKVEVARPGFINFWLSKTYLGRQIEEVLKKEKEYGNSDLMVGKKIMVEFGHPNTHKEMHIGHMRTLITGEALARISIYVGANVFRANYQGDIGPHVAKAIYGTRLLLKERGMSFDESEKLSNKEKAHLLGEGYVRGNSDYETHKEEIDLLNKKLYAKDEKVWQDYTRTRKWSLDYYNDFYKRFGTTYDQLFFESDVFKEGKKIVLENVGKVFEKSQGAVIFPGSMYGLHDRVFVTQDGNPTYEGKEMALAYQQSRAFPFDQNIHVVANEQSGYFQVVIKALETLDPKFKGREYHLPMGMVQIVGMKMSSRTGQIITVDDLLDKVKSLIIPLIKKEGLTKKEIDDIAEKVTIGAVKYSVLRVDPKMNVLFDIEKSVSLNGDSGPYLQYTYARCESVMRKIGDAETNDVIPAKAGIYKNLYRSWIKSRMTRTMEYNSEELAALRMIYKFPEVVLAAGEKLAPNVICGFLFDLAQKYNNFYNKHSILNAENEDLRKFRLALTKATATVLKNGLGLLGIAAPRKM